LGGKQGLEKAVERFYEKLVTDPKLERFFSNVDLVLLKAHQHNLIRYALSTTTTTTPSLAPPSPSSASNSSASSSATPSSSIIKSSISITNSSSNDHEKHFRDFLLKRHERLFEMGLDETHLDRVVSHLEDTLREMHVSNQVIEQAKERLWPLRSMVFQAGAAPFQKQQEKRTHGPIDIYKPQFDRIYNTFVGRMTPFVIMITSTGVAILAIFWTLWDLPPPVSGMLVVPDWGQEV
jgi:truncated hemoglobin YjbI